MQAASLQGSSAVQAGGEGVGHDDGDHTEGGRSAPTPLFRNADGGAIRVAQVRAVVKALMGSLGLDPRRFGAHSLRIGGATAGLAGKLDEQTLRAAGRWQSDAADLYIRASKEAMMNMAIVIGSTPFEDLERGVFMDEDLMLTTVGLRAAHARAGGSDED